MSGDDVIMTEALRTLPIISTKNRDNKNQQDNA